jgi:hypothetical protein
MERKRYYVSVQSKSIMENQGEAAYELEIEATPEEVEQLTVMFENQEDFELDTFFRAHYIAVPYHHDNANDFYDGALKAIYEKLHALGTEETKKHIDSMHVFE